METVVMFALGLVLGFVGAGGAGVVISLLTLVFNIPIHIALGTSLSAMFFTTFSGAYSHLREGNVVVKTGLAVGIIGAVGAFIGAHISHNIQPNTLRFLTAGMLCLSAILLWLRTSFHSKEVFSQSEDNLIKNGPKFWLTAISLGLFTGTLSGSFGIGATPFIQLGLLIFFGLTIYQSAGTTMLVILPIAALGGLGFYNCGYLDMYLLFKVTAGLMSGTYIGAKFTRKLPAIILKTSLVLLPAIGAILLLVNKNVQ